MRESTQRNQGKIQLEGGEQDIYLHTYVAKKRWENYLLTLESSPLQVAICYSFETRLANSLLDSKELFVSWRKNKQWLFCSLYLL
jgi:hypothetical protein